VIEDATRLFRDVKAEMAKAIIGQGAVIAGLIAGLLTDRHMLLEGVPGTAKTLMARALAHCMSAGFKRLQFTPDLMPSDIVGTNVYNTATGEFNLNKGPVFTDILLADEINRTPPKTQAALLEAMEEKQVSIDGVTHPLSPCFFVVATQNPVEYEGTYPLPEAQSDRFMMKLTVGYPHAEQEAAMLKMHHEGMDPFDLQQSGMGQVTDINGVLAAREALKAVKVRDEVLAYVVNIVRATRSTAELTLGASPRSAVALLRTGKAMAIAEGRDYLTPDDVKRAAPAVMRHRLILKPETEIEGATPDDVVSKVCGMVKVPR